MVPVIISYKIQVNRLSINPNFGCLTRTALEMRFERRRKVKTGKRVMIGWDVSGMGLANSKHGEEWVNNRIKAAIRLTQDNLRSGDCVGQLNSGDEFVATVPAEDAEGVMAKIAEIFGIWSLREDGKPAVYIACVDLDEGLAFKANANNVMNKVYKIKKASKG
jgi:GGDEF domain-containing protein